MREFDPQLLKTLYTPSPDSHKGKNGKVLIIAGSHLFHAASLWSLEVASRIVDMVFYSSVPENNKIVEEAKQHFRDGIVVKREMLENYIQEADCILLGPGLVRDEGLKKNLMSVTIEDLSIINSVKNEGEQTYLLTQYILTHYPEKKYVLDAGSLQMLNPDWLLKLKEMPILTPHHKEFEQAFTIKLPNEDPYMTIQLLEAHAKKYNCVILLKGKHDMVISPSESVAIQGGNAGMTKGGTGDVLAGLVSAFYAKNDALLAACCASYINKKAGEALFQKVGFYFNASDLSGEIPYTMKKLLL